jgi:hypothetical protein
MNVQKSNSPLSDDRNEDERDNTRGNGDLTDLGKVISKHPVIFTGNFGLVGTIAIILGVFIGPLLACGPILLMPDGFNEFLEDPLFFIAFFIVGSIFTMYMVPIFIRVVNNYRNLKKQTLILYDMGFTLKIKSGKQIYHKGWLWEDVETIKHIAIPMRSRGGTRYDFTAHSFEISGNHGNTITIDRNYRRVLNAEGKFKRRSTPKSYQSVWND